MSRLDSYAAWLRDQSFGDATMAALVTARAPAFLEDERRKADEIAARDPLHDVRADAIGKLPDNVLAEALAAIEAARAAEEANRLAAATPRPTNEVRYASTTSQMAGAPGPDPSVAALMKRLAARDIDDEDDLDDDERDQVVVLDVFEEAPVKKTKTYGTDAMAMTVDYSAMGEPGEAHAGIVLREKPTTREQLVRSCAVPPELAARLSDTQLLAVLPTFAALKKGSRR